MDSSVSTQLQVLSNATFSEVLDDLCIRFLLFLPEEELSSIERICFQIEEAHWFYEDFIREINPGVPNLHLRQFIHQLLTHVPRTLISHIPLWKTETAFTEFMSYKTRVPVRGCIMLNINMDKCVLVKGWKSGASWSFPRGKIDQNEDDRDCAIRETFEETGFDLTGMVAGDKIDINIREQHMRLYIAPGVPEDTEFAPRTRKEISKIAWHKLSELPGYSSKKAQKEQNSQGRFFLVAPFIRELRKWIATNGKEWLERQQRAAASKQEQIASAAETLTKAQAELQAEEDPSPPPPPPDAKADGSVTDLRSLLGISGTAPAKEPVQVTHKEEASRRLREMTGGNPQTPQPQMINGTQIHGPPTSLPDNPNAKVLLSILQGGPAPAPQITAITPNSPPSHISPHPNFMAFPPTGSQNQQPGMPGQPHYQAPPLLQTRQPLGQLFQNSQLPMPSPSTWQHGPNSFSNRSTNNFHLPSPPPTSRFGPPPLPMPQYQQHQPRGSVNQFYPNQQAMQQTGNATHHQFGQQLHHAPPTPVDGFLPASPPAMVPSKPQDPGQVGTLLSILKGTGPVPVTNTSSAQQPRRQKAAPPQQPSQQQAPPQQPPKSSTPKPIRMPGRTTPTQLPSGPAPLRSPPPRGPKSHNTIRNSPQRHPSQRQRVINMSGRPSTAIPPPQAYAPPPRPITTQPPHKSPPPLLRQGTPVVIDHYGTQKTPALPTTSFDRRESVSGEQAQTLLAMFRKPNAAAVAHVDETVMPNPEAEKRRPVLAPRRTGTPVRRGTGPVGQAKAGLLAYLEGVANQGGGVSLT